jgi:hypothetical protein
MTTVSVAHCETARVKKIGTKDDDAGDPRRCSRTLLAVAYDLTMNTIARSYAPIATHSSATHKHSRRTLNPTPNSLSRPSPTPPPLLHTCAAAVPPAPGPARRWRPPTAKQQAARRPPAAPQGPGPAPRRHGGRCAARARVRYTHTHTRTHAHTRTHTHTHTNRVRPRLVTA